METPESTPPIDLAKFKGRLIDDGYVVLWSIPHRKWLRLHSIDAKAGLKNGSFAFDSPDGSQPPVELTQSAFRKR